MFYFKTYRFIFQEGSCNYKLVTGLILLSPAEIYLKKDL